MTKCPRCSHACRPSARFCEECGYSLAIDVVTDAPPYGFGNVECASNATSLRPEDRRQATVLFTDISAFTEECARSDPELVQELLSRFYAMTEHVIDKFGGGVFDRIGDSVMGVFGAPIAHANDPERAVRAALEMHEVSAKLAGCDGTPLSMHVGVACGEVVAGIIVSGGRTHFAITGDTVNLAARLQSMAKPGETLISEKLYRSVATLVEARFHGVHAIKGFPLPAPVWAIQRLCDAVPFSSPFVGRQSELAKVRAVRESLRRTGEGGTIIIRGQAGIGKSRLAAELRSEAVSDGFQVPWEPVLDFGVDKGKAAIPALLKSIFGVTSCNEADVRESLQRALAEGRVADRDEAFIAGLLDLNLSETEIAVVNALDNSTRSTFATDALITVLHRAASARPLLLTIEDVHWAAPEFQRLLVAIARRSAEAPMILILTTRGDDERSGDVWETAISGAPLLMLDLEPLDPSEAHQLATHWIDSQSDFVHQCIDRAEGNPLFLEQLLQTPHAIEANPIPSTVQSLVLERIDRLSAAERFELQAASVFGKRFPEDGLRAITENENNHFKALMAACLIRPSGAQYEFVHGLVHEAVYASILKSKRRIVHGRIAEWIGIRDPVSRAEHLDRASGPEAPAAYLSAVTYEMKHFRIDAALALAHRGLTLANEPIVKCELSFLYAELLRESGNSLESIERYRATLQLATSDEHKCRSWMGIAAGCRITGAFSEAIEALARAQEIASALKLDVENSQIHNLRGNLFYAHGDIRLCEIEHTLAYEYANQSANFECEVRALSGMGDAQLEMGRMRQALESFRRCVTLCKEQGRIALEIPNRCMLAHCLRYSARLEQAVAEVRRAYTDAQKTGLVPAKVFSAMTLATILVDVGNKEEAEQICLDGIALARSSGARRFESSLRLSLAEVRLGQGRKNDAKHQIKSALRLARETGLGFAGAAIYGMAARAADGQNERESTLRKGAALLRLPCTAHSALRFYVNAIEASITAPDWNAARKYANALERYTSAEPLPWATLLVARARALADVHIGMSRPEALRRLEAVRHDTVATGLGAALELIDATIEKLSQRSKPDDQSRSPSHSD
ncbi:adenylate/guanylate cyclase [Burkholderia sp. H160]|nr:adenylate/guanylate cyclase [Burkholderia sp. H160]